METATVGNTNLISNEEEVLADFLRRRNLDMVNRTSAKVVPAKNFYSKYIKRGLDLLIGIPAFAVTLPFNVLFGICTFFDVGRPIFYKQTRVGKDGKPFTMVKFRNMNEKKDEDGNLLPANQRVTRFGRFMRKYSLDELLNFWHVIKGEMSIIGPRPMPTFFADRMSERHKMRHAVRPGLECPRVLKENPDVSLYQQQFENDVWYVEHISFTADIKMVILLVKMTLNIKKRTKAAQGSEYFAGYDQNGEATSLKRFKRLHPELWKAIKE